MGKFSNLLQKVHPLDRLAALLSLIAGIVIAFNYTAVRLYLFHRFMDGLSICLTALLLWLCWCSLKGVIGYIKNIY